MFKNTFWLGISQFIQVALAAIIGIMLARYLGATEYGQYTFAISFTALFGVLIDFGFSTYLINEIARDKSKLNSYLGNILSLKILIIFVFFAVLYILLAFSGKPFDVRLLVYVTGLTLVFNSFSVLFYAIFRAHEKMELEAFFTSGLAILNFILVLVCILLKFELLKILLMSLIVSVLGVIAVFFFVKKKITRIALKRELPFWKKLLKDIVPFLLSGIFINIYFYIAQVMLSFMKGDEITGWYGAIYKILAVITAITGVYFGVYFPVASRLFKENKKKLELLVHVTVRIGFMISFPLALIVTILAKPIVLLVFGEQFLGSVSALQILIWAAVFGFVCSAFSSALLAGLERNIYTFGVAFGALVNIVANLILIPRFSLDGAAIAMIITELFVFIFMFYWFNKKIFKFDFTNYFFRSLIASFFMGLILYYLNFMQFNIWFIIFISLFCYVLLLLLVRALKKDELVMTKKILFNK